MSAVTPPLPCPALALGGRRQARKAGGTPLSCRRGCWLRPLGWVRTTLLVIRSGIWENRRPQGACGPPLPRASFRCGSHKTVLRASLWPCVMYVGSLDLIARSPLRSPCCQLAVRFSPASRCGRAAGRAASPPGGRRRARAVGVLGPRYRGCCLGGSLTDLPCGGDPRAYLIMLDTATAAPCGSPAQPYRAPVNDHSPPTRAGCYSSDARPHRFVFVPTCVFSHWSPDPCCGGSVGLRGSISSTTSALLLTLAGAMARIAAAEVLVHSPERLLHLHIRVRVLPCLTAPHCCSTARLISCA